MAENVYVSKIQNLALLKAPGGEPVFFQLGIYKTSDPEIQQWMAAHPSCGNKFRKVNVGVRIQEPPEQTTRGVVTTASEPARATDVAESAKPEPAGKSTGKAGSPAKK